MQWANKAGSSLADLGSPLGFGQVLTKSGSMIAPVGVAGYPIMQGESVDEVKSKLKDHPPFMQPGMATIEVCEMMPVSI
jgi:hypothetical protein